MVIQVSYSIHTEIYEEGNILPIKSRYIKDLCKWKGIEIVEGHMMSDHVHLLLPIPSKYSISQIKGKSAMMILKDMQI